MKRLCGAVLLVGVVTVGLSCGGKEPTMTGPGEVKVRLTSPNSGLDSAITFTITGPAALTSAVPGAGLRLFQQPLGGTSTRFALIGQLSTGAVILTIGVQDISELTQYSGSITGVALPNYNLRPLPGGYALALTR
ncbi:MAG: hypothetical protein DMD40_06340 [Gemmatimonadetes bacterium]|nr:MAG: hypothetical protein DMD40_06340 [Gemmatimonadota bacterium]